MSDFKEYLISRLDQMDDFYDKPKVERDRIVTEIQNDYIDRTADEADALNDKRKEGNA